LERELPERVAFAYLDGDFYDSLKTSLQALYPRMTPGAIAIVDDYCDADANPRAWDLLPGAKIASDEFFSDKPEQMYVLVGSGNLGFGYVRKLP
jgi:O-methyltransferase